MQYLDRLPHDVDFQCPRCGQRMEEPRLLPCLHPICLSCVYELMSKRKRRGEKFHLNNKKLTTEFNIFNDTNATNHAFHLWRRFDGIVYLQLRTFLQRTKYEKTVEYTHNPTLTKRVRYATRICRMLILPYRRRIIPYNIVQLWTLCDVNWSIEYFAIRAQAKFWWSSKY